MFNKKQITVAISAALLSSSAVAEQIFVVEHTANETAIEKIQVIGNRVDLSITDPVTSFTVLENIMPAQAFAVGGAGGFTGFSERGTKSNHTVVYRNGVPVNDAGAGWYDFGHDIATGNESAAVKHGPQGVLYGSASMGGAVFINDNFQSGAVAKVSDGTRMLSSTPVEFFNFTRTVVNNGSVRSDNAEDDVYKNTTVRVQSKDVGFGFAVNYAYTEYSYDYDDCYDANWSASNSCVQQGERQSASIRNDNITLGYNSNKADYYTDVDYLSYSSDAENYYVDARESWSLTNKLDVITGLTATREEYIGKTANSTAVYAFAQYNDVVDFGLRYTGDATVGRLGTTYQGVTVSASTSYRNPNLYELNGDGAWVFENQELAPEKGKGIELTYDAFTVFKYKFTQGIDFDASTSSYVNTGEYSTRGIRFDSAYSLFDGDLTVYAGYTDTDQPGVPARKASVGYSKQMGKFTVNAQYTMQQDRGVDWSNTAYQDIRTTDLFVSYELRSNIDITMSLEDVFDREFEIAPGYAAGGREIALTFQYRK